MDNSQASFSEINLAKLKILKEVHKKVEKRPSEKDSNFNYIHLEDVIDLIEMAFSEGRKFHR